MITANRKKFWKGKDFSFQTHPTIRKSVEGRANAGVWTGDTKNWATFNPLCASGEVTNRDILDSKDDSKSQRAQDSESLTVCYLRAPLKYFTGPKRVNFIPDLQSPPPRSQTEHRIRTHFFFNRSWDSGLRPDCRHYVSTMTKNFCPTVDGLAARIYRNLTRLTPLSWQN